MTSLHHIWFEPWHFADESWLCDAAAAGLLNHASFAEHTMGGLLLYHSWCHYFQIKTEPTLRVMKNECSLPSLAVPILKNAAQLLGLVALVSQPHIMKNWMEMYQDQKKTISIEQWRLAIQLARARPLLGDGHFTITMSNMLQIGIALLKHLIDFFDPILFDHRIKFYFEKKLIISTDDFERLSIMTRTMAESYKQQVRNIWHISRSISYA